MQRNLRVILSVVVFALGAIHAWNTRDYMNPDGITYLDLGDACLNGNSSAINAYWSPLYPCVLGTALRLAKPSIYWEFPVVHFVNFAIYLLAFWAFDFLLRQLLRYHEAHKVENGLVALPAWLWVLFGYLLFLTCAFQFTFSPQIVSPDMCVVAFVFLASGILLRIRRGADTWPMFGLLGIALGLGYLSKAVFLPFALIFLSISAFAAKSPKRAVGRVVIASLAFLLVASLYFVPLSISKGRFTFGDTGKLNYAWVVNGVTLHIHWQGEPPGHGTPIHPTRKILDHPAVYEFASPVGGTYPPWYDPSYWHEGVTLRFEPRIQMAILFQNVDGYLMLLSSATQISLIAGFLALCFISYDRRRYLLGGILRQWSLLVPSIAVFVLYAIILVEKRYVGGFIVLMWLGLYFGAQIPYPRKSRTLAMGIVIAVASVIVISVGRLTFPAAVALGRKMIKGEDYYANGLGARPAEMRQAQVAEGLTRMGVRPRDNVASIGRGSFCGWARLARIRIIAEVTDGSLIHPATQDVEDFWAADPSIRGKVITTLASTGATAIVADQVPGWASQEGWKQIGNTAYYVYFLPK
jgi:hypothetical protein